MVECLYCGKLLYGNVIKLIFVSSYMVKIVGVPCINALGHKGPEEMPLAVSRELGVDFEMVDIDNDDIEKSERQVFDCAREFFSGGERVCFVGGDHSITFPIFSAFREKFGNPFLIVFDAHADCMPPMREPTHEEFLRAIVESGFNPENVILVGARKIEPEELRFLKEKGIRVFSEINDVEAVADFITEKALGCDLYVSVDIDVLDPAFAPAVTYPEVDGLTSREFFYILKRVLRVKSLRAIDVVEAVPEKDRVFDMRTIKNCAKVISEFMR